MSRFTPRAPSLLSLALLVAGCIEPMSVGIGPLATVDASISVAEDASVLDATSRDAGKKPDGAARPVEAGAGQPNDAALADARVRDADVPDATYDAGSPDAAVDAGKPDTGTHDAGPERCPEAECAIAGISPRDTSCPNGQQSACLREPSGQCLWYCL